jgi:hypothetical protein
VTLAIRSDATWMRGKLHLDSSAALRSTGLPREKPDDPRSNQSQPGVASRMLLQGEQTSRDLRHKKSMLGP